MNIAVFDVETNGLAGSSVLSASSIVFNEKGFVLDVFNRFYLPHERPDRRAVYVHGLTPERLLALRRHIPAPLYFLEDWPELVEFWERWHVAGVVVHNLAFDASFLPEIAQGALLWWCSMRGLTEFCAIPRRPGNLRRGDVRFKWPKLGEAADKICNGPSALTPPKETGRIENLLGEIDAHVSLFDCFELYRVVVRIAKHASELLRFAPSAVPFRPPRTPAAPLSAVPAADRFTSSVAHYENILRSVIQ